jgi:N4-(beta-N-acetylglucosaminyl)-L-asparaginase
MLGPVIISTWSFGKRGNDAAWPALAAGAGSLDAVEIACGAVECDPEVDSVGFGGLPDCTGRMSLDGCIMLSPNRCGSVCAVQRFMHPVSIARRVMEKTPHIMLAGEGADAFAQAEGFSPAELLSPHAKQQYEQWKASCSVIDQSQDRMFVPGAIAPLPFDRDPGSGKLFDGATELTSSAESQWSHHDTIGVLAIDAQGVMAGACSTSGTPYKLPGRVGDSPIIGHGLYVDPRYGGAVATGSGELITSVCGCFLAVELLRRGADPVDAACLTLRRIVEHHNLQPHHQAAFIVLKRDGTHGSAALRPGFKVSYRDEETNMVWDANEVVHG